MTNIRRYPLHNRPVFLTLVCFQRKPILADNNRKKCLLETIGTVKRIHPFHMHAWVVLHDHLHLLIRNDTDSLSTIVQKIKIRFARQMGGGKCWQRRFWDHICRDETDMKNHMDYIHYNPVKHGLTKAPRYYKWSSFEFYYRKGFYAKDWGETGKPGNIDVAGSE